MTDNGRIEMEYLKRKKELQAEKRNNNNVTLCENTVVIFRETENCTRMFTPKSLGWSSGALILGLDNDVCIMLPMDKCVVIDPAGSKLGKSYPKDKFRVLYNGVDTTNEDIPAMLKDFWDHHTIDGSIVLEHINKEEEK